LGQQRGRRTAQQWKLIVDGESYTIRGFDWIVKQDATARTA
jgi:hypothetical protein